MTDPQLASGVIFLVMRNTFEGRWSDRLVPSKVLKSYPRVLDTDEVVLRLRVTVDAAAFDAIDAGEVYAAAMEAPSAEVVPS